jgi:hypothetical protein
MNAALHAPTWCQPQANPHSENSPPNFLLPWATNCTHPDVEASMLANAVVQDRWLRLFRRALQPGEMKVEKLGDGYYAAVAAKGKESADGFDECTCRRALAAWIPHIERTRAVSLSAERTYDLPGADTLCAWAGEAAAPWPRRRAVAEETQNNFARASRFFRRFATRFPSHAMAVLDHYFVAYPAASCATVGWNNWQLNGQATAEQE